jgi:thiamine pyrophosphokinase
MRHRPANLLWIMPAKGIGTMADTAASAPQSTQHTQQSTDEQTSPPRWVGVFSGGTAPLTHIAPLLPQFNTVIAADSGFAHAALLGYRVDTLIGDFDSIAKVDYDAAIASGATVHVFPTTKDSTDLELAIDAAVQLSPTHVMVVSGGSGDRLDHFLAEVALLAHDGYAHIRMSAIFASTRIDVVRPGYVHRLSPIVGSCVSLLPSSDVVTGIVTTGLAYPLNNDSLYAHRTRGISNLTIEVSATVEITDGVLLVMQPEYFRPT